MCQRRVSVNKLICNLVDYFTKEKNNFRSLKPVTSVMKKVTDTLTDVKTARKAIQNSEDSERNQNVPSQEMCMKTNDLSTSQNTVIRNFVYNMRKKRKNDTSLDRIAAKLKEKQLFDYSISETSLLAGQN